MTITRANILLAGLASLCMVGCTVNPTPDTVVEPGKTTVIDHTSPAPSSPHVTINTPAAAPSTHTETNTTTTVPSDAPATSTTNSTTTQSTTG
jgi:ABC-type uncharacterized transport system auxiliary subunit